MGEYISILAGSQEQTEAIIYGFEIVIRTLIKVLTISLVSYYLGIFYETWVIVAFSSLLRTFSGGVHCSKYIHCLLIGSVIFSLLGLSVKFINPFLAADEMLPALILSTLLLQIICVIWIPLGNETRPLGASHDIKKFKIGSFIIITLHFLISYSVLQYLYLPQTLVFVLASILGLVWQGFTVTPFGYHLITKLDSFLSFFTLKGGEWNDV